METAIDLSIRGIWIAVGLVWLAASWGVKRTVRRQSAPSRLVHMLIMCAVFALLFSGYLSIGPLAWRIAPDTPVFLCSGLAMTIAGCAIAVWARLLLGGNWSGSVTVKQGHSLIRQGPYAIVRHPIYSGGLLGLMGTAVAFGELRGFLGVALAFIGWSTKSRMEEAFMIEQFGDNYRRYQREVKRLIPFVL